MQSTVGNKTPHFAAPPPMVAPLGTAGVAGVVVTPLTELVVLYLPTMYKYCACKGTRFPSTPYNICGPPSPVARFLRNYTSHLHTFWSCVIINTLAVLFIPDLFVSGPFYFRTKLFPHFPLWTKNSIWQLSYNLYLPLNLAFPSVCGQFLAVN